MKIVYGNLEAVSPYGISTDHKENDGYGVYSGQGQRIVLEQLGVLHRRTILVFPQRA